MPMIQSAPTARKPSSICSDIKFNPAPSQKSSPKTSARDAATVKTMEAIRITMTAIGSFGAGNLQRPLREDSDNRGGVQNHGNR